MRFTEKGEVTLLEKVYQLNEIGIALSLERDHNALLDRILQGARQLTGADGGTLYTVTADKKLRFEILRTHSLGLFLGGTSGKPIAYGDIPLHLPDGTPNETHIVAYAVNHDMTLNVKDAYTEQGFDFAGTKLFDQKTGYRTQSVLTIPIQNHEKEVIAALQLINCIDPLTKNVVPFSTDDQQLAESLASQAGVAITNQNLIRGLKDLFEAFIRVIAETVDEKSPVMGKHGRRVPILTEMLARAINETKEGPLKNVFFSEDELYELKVAAFLHDCGKIVTPIQLMEKGPKLEAIFDRMALVSKRFDVAAHEAKIKNLEAKLAWYEKQGLHPDFQQIDSEYERELKECREDEAFVLRCNKLEEKITDEAKKRIERLGAKGLLTPDEIEHLSIPQGNLTEKERKIIEYHVVMTQKMLDRLPYPKDLRAVPEIAGSHHEWVNGRGYPKGLTGGQMSIRAKILPIADIFEALSAPDRSYKKILSLSEILPIMQKMCDEGHLDANIFEVFCKQKVYMPYARQFLRPEQIDLP